MEEYLQQITHLVHLNGDAVEGMLVVNKAGIVEYYKPGGSANCLRTSAAMWLAITCSRSTPNCPRRTVR